MRNVFILLFCVIFFPVSAQQSSISPFLKDSINNYVERSRNMWNIPGVAICVVKDGEVVYQQGFGTKELGKEDKVNENTLFLIASNTKAMTGTLMAMLEQDGKWTMDDNVKKWYPEFNMKDDYITENATLTDIISHRLGMETFQGDFMYIDSDLSAKEIIRKMGKLNPVYNFRTKWGYCNAGYALAGECIQAASGESWEENMQKRLFEPLGMKQTIVFSKDIVNAQNKASAHTFENGILRKIPYGEMDAMAPAGSVCSSVNDMSRWMIALLDSGRIEGKQVIPFEAIKKTREPVSIIGKGRHPFNRTNYITYGMGWVLQDYEGREMVSHTGGIHGFVTSVTLLPQENLGIVVLTNTDQNSFYEALKWEIVDSYLDLPYRDYSGFYYTRAQKRKEHNQKELSALKDSVGVQNLLLMKTESFAGTYENEVYGKIFLKKNKKNKIEMTFEHHPGLIATLEQIGNNRFLSTYNNPVYEPKVIPFHIENNIIKGFTFSVSDFIEFTTYDFFKIE